MHWRRIERWCSGMSTTLMLMRHGSIDGLGVRLMGRRAGIHLNETGRREILLCQQSLAELPIQRVFSSPLERAQETASSVAEHLCVSVDIFEELNELDFGDWTGEPFAALAELPSWQAFNRCRVCAEIPGGETIRKFSARVASGVERIRAAVCNGLFLVVTHAEWIRTAAAVCLNLPLDVVKHFQLMPASISILRFDSHSVSMAGWNCSAISREQISES
jgi:broad specificity phosphatase PhoE